MSLRPTSVALAVVALLALLAVAGCGSPRFGALPRGSYACVSSVTSSTCGTDVASGSRTEPLDGAGTDSISFLAPEGAFFGRADAWGSVQFGAQADPDAYEANATTTCTTAAGGHEYFTTEHDQLTTVASDHIDMTLTFDYSSVGACGYAGVTGDTCRLVYAMTCTHVP